MMKILPLVFAVMASAMLGIWPMPGLAAEPAQVFRDCSDCPEMIVVPPGTAPMGSAPSERGHAAEEAPRHEIRLEKPLAVGLYPVTRSEYAAYAHDTKVDMAASRSYFPGGDRDPVVDVSWTDAMGYVAWLSRRSGHRYRLPSEAEWEYAARGGTRTWFFWGDAAGRGRANCMMCGSRWDGDSTSPVGSFPPNGFGLFDMAGNVYQWVADCFRPDYGLGDSNAASVFQTESCSRRMLRGGSWMSNPDDLRPAARFQLEATDRQDIVGFRVVRSLDE